MLRIGESLRLKAEHLLLPGSAQDPQVVIVCLPVSKRGFDQHVVISDPAAVAFVLAYREQYPFSGPLAVPCSYARFRSRFLKGLEVLNLRPAVGSWKTHSLRRGAASSMLERGAGYADVQLFGRWASERSCREYVKRGTTLMTQFSSSMAPDVKHKVELLARCLLCAAEVQQQP